MVIFYFFFLLFLVFNNIFKYQLLRVFDHICMEKARYKFLIIIIIIIYHSTVDNNLMIWRAFFPLGKKLF